MWEWKFFLFSAISSYLSHLPLRSSFMEVIFHLQNFQNCFKLCLSRPAKLRKQVLLISSYIHLVKLYLSKATNVLTFGNSNLWPSTNLTNTVQQSLIGAWHAPAPVCYMYVLYFASKETFIFSMGIWGQLSVI